VLPGGIPLPVPNDSRDNQSSTNDQQAAKQKASNNTESSSLTEQVTAHIASLGTTQLCDTFFKQLEEWKELTNKRKVSQLLFTSFILCGIHLTS
jgi:hypothetical protein